MQTPDTPEEIATAVARHKAFQLRTGIATVFMVAMFFVGFLTDAWLGKPGVIGFMMLGAVPLALVTLAGLRKDILRDADLVAAWRRREAQRLASPDADPAPPGTDERWSQAAPLLARLRELLDPDDRPVLERAEAHLRQVWTDLRLIDEAISMEQSFEDSGRRVRLEASLAQAQDEWSKTLGLLRDLHLELSTRRRGDETLAALDGLVGMAVAATEVESASGESESGVSASAETRARRALAKKTRLPQ